MIIGSDFKCLLAWICKICCIFHFEESVYTQISSSERQKNHEKIYEANQTVRVEESYKLPEMMRLNIFLQKYLELWDLVK